MQWLSSAGASLVLFDYEPNWSVRPEVSLRVPGLVERGLTGAESRRAFAGSARYKLRFTAAAFNAASARRLRQGLLRLRDELMAMPLWTDGATLAAAAAAGDTALTLDGAPRARSGAQWALISEDRQTVELLAATASSATSIALAAPLAHAWPAGATVWPLLFGRFAQGKRPRASSITDEACNVEVEWEESSDYTRRAWAEGALATVGATVPAHAAERLWDMEPDFARPVDETELDEMASDIGFLREDYREAYGGEVRRALEWSFKGMTAAQIGRAERFFVERAGSLRRFWAPTWLGDLGLAEDLPMRNPVLMHVQGDEYLSGEYDDHPGQPYLCLIDDGAPVPVRVNAVGGSVLTLAAAVPRAFDARRTIVSHLLLCRFATDELTWSYAAPGNATASLRVVEVPGEYLAPAEERTPAFLYEFTEDLPTPVVSRFTSYEAPLVVAGQAWTPAPFAHHSLRGSVRLEREEMEVESWKFPGNPLGKFLPWTLEGPLRVRVYELADPGAPASPVLRFAGEIGSASNRGRRVTGKAVAIGRRLDRKFPCDVAQRTCNVALYSGPCGVDKTAWRKAAAVQAATTGSTVLLAGSGLAAAPANRFAYGYVEFSGGAGFFARRGILSQAAGDGAAIQCQVDRPIVLSGAETAWVYPGCDGSFENCAAFNNADRFRGFPYMPDTNPSLKALDVPTSQSGK